MRDTYLNEYGQKYEFSISNNNHNGTHVVYDANTSIHEGSVRVPLYGSDGSQLAQIVKTFDEITTAPNDWDLSNASVKISDAPI